MIGRRLFLAIGLACAGFAAYAQGPVDDNILVIEVEGAEGPKGAVEIELLPQLAPKHVDRVKSLARAGAYDGVAFHRVIPGFMAQTGDVEYGHRDVFAQGRAGFGGSEEPDLPAEFTDEPFVEGIVGMARGGSPDSANSQFFIMFDDGQFLNGQYTVFGRVLAGMEVVHAIKKGDRAENGVIPTDPDFMARAFIKGDQ